MKTTLSIFALILFSAFGVSAQKSAGGKVDPTKGVHDAFDRLIEGIKQVDAAKVMDAYENSPRLMVFNNNGTTTIGWESVNTNVRLAYSKISNVTIDISGLQISMLGNNGAYVFCRWKQTQENEGKLEDASGRMTLVYKLVGKDWKITHRHTSPDNPAASRPVFPSERQ